MENRKGRERKKETEDRSMQEERRGEGMGSCCHDIVGIRRLE